MKPNGVLNLILPAREIVHDHGPTDVLLATMETSTKELIEMFLKTWAEMKHYDRFPDYGSSDRDFHTSLRINAHLLVCDIIFEAMEKRIERGLKPAMPEDDRRAAEQVMMSIWASLSEYIFNLLVEMQISDLQLSQLQFVRWVDNDFVVSIPLHRTAVHKQWEDDYAARRELEQNELRKLAETSPFCYYGSGRRDNELEK